MRLKFTISLFLITVLLPDVLGKPPLPVASEFWENSKGSVAIVLMSLPDGGRFYQRGSQGLLDIAIAGTAASDEVKWVRALDVEQFASVADLFATELEALGYNVSVYGTRPTRESLEKREKRKKGQFKFDLSSIFEETGASRIILLELSGFGFSRSYYSMIPTGSPVGVAYVRGCMIERGDHRLLWDTKWRYGTINEQIIGEWKEPPDYPNLQNAINRALGRSKKFLAERFFEIRLSNAAYDEINEDIMAVVRERELELDESEERIENLVRRGKVEQHLIGIDSHSGVTAGCRQPYRLKRDCNNWKGALRNVTINDIGTRVAGSEEGNVVLMMAPKIGKASAPEDALDGFVEVALLLEENGFEIKKVTGMRVLKKYFGYWIETEGDAYSLLTPFSD